LQLDLDHVRDIEQSGRLARVKMFFHHAKWIEQRHRPSGERAHLGAMSDVQIVECGGFEFRRFLSHLPAHSSAGRRIAANRTPLSAA